MNSSTDQLIATARTSQLLIDDHPLQLLPRLAKAIGLNEAIFLQQLHYWLQRAQNTTRDGRPWVYNNYEQWAKQFPFWSLRTLQRAVLNLERMRLIESARFEAKKYNQRKWYTINYTAVERSVHNIDEVITWQESFFGKSPTTDERIDIVLSFLQEEEEVSEQ